MPYQHINSLRPQLSPEKTEPQNTCQVPSTCFNFGQPSASAGHARIKLKVSFLAAEIEKDKKQFGPKKEQLLLVEVFEDKTWPSDRKSRGAWQDSGLELGGQPNYVHKLRAKREEGQQRQAETSAQENN